MKQAFKILIFIFYSSVAIAQEFNIPSLSVKAASDLITVDGKMEEASWKEAEVAEKFVQYYPFDTSYAKAKSEIRMTYDENTIYIYAKLYDGEGGNYITTSLRRDFRGTNNDSFSIIFDTFQDRTNAFVFGVNPFGVRREGLISDGGDGRGSFDLSWDNKWTAASIIEEDYWATEIAIPFKTIRFKEGTDQWNVNFYRIDTRYNERSTWTPIPRQFNIFSLAYSSRLQWDKPLPGTGANITVIPYVAGSVGRNHEDGESTKLDAEAGADIKVAVTPGLNLDLTFNPDFSQVEVDRQVTNLSRFEIFFPERRQFFLENADLFSGMGFPRQRPFFSRRIGIVRDTVNDETIANRIIYGARLSGKLDNNWRLGILNMQTQKHSDIGLPGTNYAVGIIQRKLFTRSNITAFAVNKQNFNSSTENDSSKFNRVFGVDLNLASADNKWSADLFYHQSVNPFKQSEDYVHGAFIGFNTLKYELRWSHTFVGENYDAQVGFVPRTGFNRINPSGGLNFYPNTRVVNNHGPSIRYEYSWQDSLGRTDSQVELSYNINFQNTARFELELKRDFTYLFSDFDPTNTDGIPLTEGNDFTYDSYEITYNSDSRNNFNYRLTAIGGEYFNGTRYGVSGSLNYRYQPFGNFSLNFNYNHIELPAPHSDANLLLIGPRLDFTFTKKLFLTTFLQYNNQVDNFNINTRFQWRFKPVSDIFIVYTDNYDTGNFNVKNRALVFKVTYWLNL